MTMSVPIIAAEALRNGRASPERLARIQRKRLAELVRHSRTTSPFYRRAYRGLPEEVTDPRVLPPVDKPTLMANFDEWVTDPAITLEQLRTDFLSDLSLVGHKYLGRYHVMTTSGSTGEPAVLVHDQLSWRVLHVLARTRPHLLGGKANPKDLLRRGVRVAALYATGGHFGGVVLLESARAANPVIARRSRAFSVQRPISDLVGELNEFQPTMLGGYPSAMVLLAGEQLAGRLRIDPLQILCAGELLTDSMRAEIQSAFHCPIGEGYAATEVPGLSLQCTRGRLHVNIDWYVLEPTDSEHRPVPVGQTSSTVLVTNLSNRVQPVIRYDLGDRVTMSPEPCPCGSPLPTVAVEGRTNDVLTFESPAREPVVVLPLALGAVIEETPGVHRFQAIGTGPTALTVRLEPEPGASPDLVWRDLEDHVQKFLAAQGIAPVAITRAADPPRADPRSGKLRQVIRA